MNVYKCDDCANQRTDACNTCLSTHGRKPTQFKAKESGNMTNVTVLTDELGLQREYREVKRKAAVGERIKVTNYTPRIHAYAQPEWIDMVLTVKHVDSVGDVGDVKESEVHGYIFYAPKSTYSNGPEYVVLEPTDIIRVDNERYRLVERKAIVGERVVVTKTGTHGFAVGDVTEIIEINEGYPQQTRRGSGHICGWLYESQYLILEPIKSAKLTVDIGANPDVIGLIANLSTRLAEAERKIAALEGAKESDNVDLLVSRPAVYRKPSYVSERALTRDDVIERAKADVAELLRTCRKGSDGRRGFWPEVSGTLTKWIPMQRVEFVVNREKRTVVALIRYLPHYGERNLYAKGIAKCAPDDVFNTHIGRAIALRRALGLDVPDAYVNAPKPTEAKVGDIVTFNDHDAGKVLYRVDSLGGGWNCTVIYCDAKFGGSTGAGGKAAGGNFAWARIIDDSSEEVNA